MNVGASERGLAGGVRRAGPMAALAAAAGLALPAAGQLSNLGGNGPAATPGPGPAIPAQPMQPIGVPPSGGTIYTLPAFAEGVQIKELVDYVVNTLKINVVVDPNLSGEVVINRPISVERDGLLRLLNDILEQQQFMIYQEASGWYQVVRITPETIPYSTSTTRLIATPNMRPSSLRSAVESVFPPSRASSTRVVYLDDLGIIMVTDTPRIVESVELVITQIRDRLAEQEWYRIELINIAAPTARDRAIEMVGGARAGGQSEPTAQIPGQFQPPGQQQGATRTASLITNIEARLRVDVQGNGLVFYGREEEVALIRKVISQIDVATVLESRSYEAGAYARQIADLAKGQGLGDVIVVEDTSRNQQQQGFVFPGFPQQQQQTTQTPAGGSRMIVDVKRGRIIYFGTPQQHAFLDRLIQETGLEADAVTIEHYRLQNAAAEDVADLLRQLILGQSASGQGGLLPTGGAPQGATFNPFVGLVQPPDSGGVSLFGDENTSIIADVANNQVLVRAPANLQPQYERLIGHLDRRREQVYIRAHIVAVSNTRASRLAFETQIINATGDPVLQTNFGLSEAGPSILDPRDPLTNLTGLTTAVIRSKYVPVIMHATATDSDTRIISSPQLLVNDNFEASIVSTDEQPTTTTTQTQGNPAQTSFGGYEQAGTRLIVTPSISGNGWIRLNYEIELSNFVGFGSDGVPPPRQTRTLQSEAVTIPSDTTIVVGGIVIEDTRNTVVKIPILGDIPLVGHLFRDTNKSDTGAVLYVFITPYIMSDPAFQDMRLLTRGPQSDVGLADDMPRIAPRPIEIITPAPRLLEP